MRIGVCLKLQDRQPEIDPLTGAVHHDPRFTGLSDPDQAALEWAFRCADTWGGEVVAVTAGPPEADSVLQFALAGGACAERVAMAAGAPSETVAVALAARLAGCALVWCGDQSLDRGSGSVPAYLAAHLHAAQALGLVDVVLDPGAPGQVVATRRLDGGRRERLLARAPAVLSVEGSTARLRRAPVDRWLAARRAPVEVHPGPPVPEPVARTIRPFRPRPRELAPPTGPTPRQRILALTGGTPRTPAAATSLSLEPDDAATRLVAQLVAWGYLDEGGP